MVLLSISRVARALSPRVMTLKSSVLRDLWCTAPPSRWTVVAAPSGARSSPRLFASSAADDSSEAASPAANPTSSQVQARLADRRAKNLDRAAKATDSTAAAGDSAAEAPGGHREWNVAGLRKEIDRQVMRQFKKVSIGQLQRPSLESCANKLGPKPQSIFEYQPSRAPAM